MTAKKYDYILWDWNGTLLDDLDESLAAINRTLKKAKLPAVDKERYFRVFGFPIRDYYSRLGFDFIDHPYEYWAVDYIDNYLEEAKVCGLQNDAEEVLRTIQAMEIEQLILSASTDSMIRDKLKELGIEEYFSGILCLDNIYAKSKQEIGKKWKESLPKNIQVLMVGDTLHDFEVAKEIGVDVVLFDGGHSNRLSLERLGVPVISDLKEILSFLLG